MKYIQKHATLPQNPDYSTFGQKYPGARTTPKNPDPVENPRRGNEAIATQRSEVNRVLGKVASRGISTSCGTGNL